LGNFSRNQYPLFGNWCFSLSESRITADLADFADFGVSVYPTFTVQRWVSLDISTMAGTRNKSSFFEMLTLGSSPFNPTYGTVV
jgi:hypothetical protein